MTDREVLAKRLNEVGLLENRFIPVRDGTKKSVVAHQKPQNRHSSFASLSGNYGVYAGDGLIDVDVDDYSDDADNDGLEAVNNLPETLTVESPHTDGDTGGHRYYKVTTDKSVSDYDVETVLSRYIRDDGSKQATYHAAKDDPVALGIAERFGKVNLGPSWGEIRVTNQYVVGPGSQIDSCDKEWHDCSEEGEGNYSIANDAPIAEIELSDLIDVFKQSGYDETDTQQSVQNTTNGDLHTDSDSDGYEKALEVARNDPKIVTYLTEGASVGFDGDRSDADFYVACRMIENQVPKKQAEKLLLNGLGEDNTPDTKVRERGGWYANTWENARQRVQEENPSGNVSTRGKDAVGPDNPAGQLVERNGCYGYWDQTRNDDDDAVWKQVTNFTLETLEFVEIDGGQQIHVRVHPAHAAEDAYEVTVEPTTFNDFASFKEDVVIGRTTQFSAEHGNETLNDLRMTVGAQDAPRRKGISHVGAATRELNEFVTPNGVLTANGWRDDPDYRYYAKATSVSDGDDESIVGDKWQLSPDDGSDYDTEEVKQALKNLPKARLPGRAIATLGWFYAAPAKPLIHDEEGEINHLHVRGKTESGKTSYLQVLTEAFGMDRNPWVASSTNFSLEQLHVGSRGAPVWLDEYKPSEMPAKKVDRLHMLLRLSTRESTWTKGRPNQEFMKFKTQSPIVLSGEQQIAEPAVRRRTLQVNLTERATNITKHVEAYSELAGEPYDDENGVSRIPDEVDLQDHARAYYTFLLSRDADELRDLWKSARKNCVRLLNDVGMTLEDSEFQAAQTVVFGYRMYRKLADTVGLDESELPGEDDLRDAIQHLSENVGANGQRREHGDEFLELFAGAVNAGYVHGPAEAEENDTTAAYRVYNPSVTPDEAIAVHMPTAYASVKKYAREYNLEEDYNLLAKSDYVDEFGDLADSDDTHIERTNHTARINGDHKKCVILNPYKTNERLGTDFDLSAFGLENVGTIDEDAGDSAEEDDPAFQATKLQDAAESNTGYVTVTVEIKSVNVMDGDDTPTKAVLMDSSGPMDAVTWESSKSATFEDYEGETVVIEHAKVTEYDGTKQLEVPEFAEIEKIQPGVGYTEGQATAENQSSLQAATDGGTATQQVRQHVKAEYESGEDVTVAEVAGTVGEAPNDVRQALETIQAETNLLEAGVSDPYRRL